MKLKNLEKIIILNGSIFVVYFLFSSLPAFGQEIDLANIKTNPSQIHVGESFQINATIVNDSPVAVYYTGGCQSPLSAIFDKNVAIGQAMGCFAIYNAVLKPGENTSLVGPSSNNLYTANSSGTTNANVTFSYHTENKSENTISKFYTFDILEKASIPEFPLIPIIIFTIAIMSSIVVIVSRKNHALFKL